MTSSGQKQSEIYPERATRHVETELRCTYPSERRERNQVYTLLNISNSANEAEEKSSEGINGTGWEEAVQGWNKTAPFSYLQLQKRARKPKTSESVNGCLYCLDLLQVLDKGLEQDPKNLNQLKPEFGLNACSATDDNPEKQQTLLFSNTAIENPSATEDAKKESCSGKAYFLQPSPGEKKKMTLKEAQASLSEKKFFLMKESPLFQEKKTVPIKEYNILAPEKPKPLDTLKCKDAKSYESSMGIQTGSETTSVKPSLILPPLNETALKNGLDSSAKKSKTVISQASAVSDTIPCLQLFKTKDEKYDKRIDTEYSAVKEQAKMNAIASFVPMLSKTSLISKNLDRCYWHCAVAPDRKITAMSNSIALRRHNHLKSMHCLHAKGMQINRGYEMQDPYARSRSHTGPKRGTQSKPEEIPLLSGLFPSLTVSRIAIAAMPSRLT
uniref:Uncharacterized protein n=1 Tax=Salvator merianae TaxID=96440 RepID=A0A8D0BYZ1_SALMN